MNTATNRIGGRTTRARRQTVAAGTRATTATATRAAAQAAYTGHSPSGVDTETRVTLTRPRIFARGSSRWTGWRDPRRPRPARASGSPPSLARTPAAAAEDKRDAAADREHRERPHEARHSPGQLLVADAGEGVAGNGRVVLDRVERGRSPKPLSPPPTLGRSRRGDGDGQHGESANAEARDRQRQPHGGERPQREPAQAPATRSGRLASTALTAEAVITASPIADHRVDAEHRRQHRAERHRPRRAELDARSRSAPPSPRPTSRPPRSPESPPACVEPRGVPTASGSRRRRAPMIPMLRTFAPSALMPPSANTNACVVSTTAITRQASHGPAGSRPIPLPAGGRWCLRPPGNSASGRRR